MASAQGRAGNSFLELLRTGVVFSLFSDNSAVGLSIGASSIKVVGLKRKNRQWQMVGYSSVPLMPQMSELREIPNQQQMIALIQSAVKAAGIKSKNVCSAIGGSGLIIKNLTVTASKNLKELQDVVFWEAEQYIPYEITDVVIDFQVIGKPRGDQVDVVLVAVKKDFLEQYMSVITESKLVPKIMDAEMFALQNVYEYNYDVSSTESVMLIDVGAVSTKMLISSGGVPYFTKETSFGGNYFTQEIQRELNLAGLQDAEALKVSANTPQEVRDVLSRTCQTMASEVRKAIDFYSASSLGPPISRILFSGGGSRIEMLLASVNERTNIPCEYLNPFKFVDVKIKGMDSDWSALAPEVVVPLGLALRAGAGA
jgi:type IV pilus assembly protein PilM